MQLSEDRDNATDEYQPDRLKAHGITAVGPNQSRKCKDDNRGTQQKTWRGFQPSFDFESGVHRHLKHYHHPRLHSYVRSIPADSKLFL
jgi:hypothetical protein